MTASSKPLILVLGSGGQIGRFVVEQLAHASENVRFRITARTPDRIAALRAAGHDAVLLDLDQPFTFAAALRGVDRVFLLTGYTVAMLAQSKTFVDAARKASVQHIVHLGTFGQWDCTDPHIVWHQLVETYIKASGIAWPHLHLNMFMEQMPKLMPIRNDRFPIYWGTGSVGWVAARDVGAAAAAILRGGPAVHGGKDYWFSVEAAGGQQLATLLTELLGRTIMCDYKTPEDLAVLQAAVFDAEPWYAAGALEFLRQFRNGHMADFGMVRDDTPYCSIRPRLRCGNGSGRICNSWRHDVMNVSVTRGWPGHRAQYSAAVCR